MTPLIIIITHPGAQAILNHNWPHLQVCGPPIVVQHEDKPPMTFPSPPAEVWSIGSDPHNTPHGTLGRFLKILEHVCSVPAGRDCWLVEADTIFLCHPPAILHGRIMATLAGHGDPISSHMRFHGRNYYHCPWGFNSAAIRPFLAQAQRLLLVGLYEECFIDRFIGLIADLWPYTVDPSFAWSRNTVEPQDIEELRMAIANGIFAIHGVKTPDILHAITKGL